MVSKIPQVFPYFGGKRRVAAEVWRRFGVVDGYLEPFSGSLAVALANPHPEALKSETVNDLNGFICNFWRSVAAQPEAVARAADWPVNQIDLTARHKWLREQRSDLAAALAADMNHCDPQVAGVWVWGLSQWIGSGFCKTPRPDTRPHLGHHGMGVHSLGQRPHLGDRGLGGFYDLYRRLAIRLRMTRVACCDWSSLKSALHNDAAAWGLFLDPPYTAESGRDPSLYSPAGDDSGHLTLGHEVATWAIGLSEERPEVKIALCGIEGEYPIPKTWARFHWGTSGYSYGGRARCEVIWFSPSCADSSKQASLFAVTT